MKIVTLKEWDIDSLKEQGADLEITFSHNVGLPLDFSRGYSGYDNYKVVIDSKYQCTYNRRYKRDYKDHKIFLDKIEF